MRELVVKNALASSSLPTYLSDWVNVFSNLCVYMTTQTTKFPTSHLQAGGWYLDCSRGFVHGKKKVFSASLVSSALEEYIVPFEEPDIVEFPPPPSKAPKRKGKAKNTTT